MQTMHFGWEWRVNVASSIITNLPLCNVDSKGGFASGVLGLLENSVLSAEFCCKRNIASENKVYLGDERK